MILPCTFEELRPFWSKYLWPNRLSQIEPVSCIDINTGIVSEILALPPPLFFKYEVNLEIIAVVSAQYTSAIDLRSRGLWVRDDFRRTGLGHSLVNYVFGIAAKNKLKRVWTLGRQSNAEFYHKCGFSILSSTNKYEFGPHYIMVKKF